MKAINLAERIKKYTKGWVALNKEYKVIAHAETFQTISDQFEKNKDVVIMPASNNYFGYVTNNG